MILHDWGLIDYETARKKMDEVHELARKTGSSHLIFCEHPPCFTVGADERGDWPVPTIETDRGGSITCHAPGQIVAYFCFQAPEPARFYRRVVRAYRRLFDAVLPAARYDSFAPGFYIEDRKIASLGFRYRRGVSLHGVALNVDVDLEYCNRVAPCGLTGIRASSLAAEGICLTIEEIKPRLRVAIAEAFATGDTSAQAAEDAEEF